MLASAPLIAFVPVTDAEVAREFFGTTLGLRLVSESPFAVVFDAHGTQVRVTPVPDLRPQAFTIVGWQVDDIEATVAGLTARGVAFTHYDGMKQTAAGIWITPGGDRVAWFTDPDGNTLSLTQFAAG